jgi:signal recognition particle subunit SRP68
MTKLKIKLQSIEQITSLPGVAADEDFIAELAAKSSYFRMLRTTSIACSHALLGNRKNALALFYRAHQYISSALPYLQTQSSETSHRGLEISPIQAKSQQESLAEQLARYHALVEIDTISEKNTQVGGQHYSVLDRLDQWPEKVNFQNIVHWPPRVQPVPVKPVFLDIAWNFIQYPGTDIAKIQQQEQQTLEQQAEKEEERKSLLGLLWRR